MNHIYHCLLFIIKNHHFLTIFVVENHSLYISAGNIGVYAGINYKEGIGIDAGASVLEIGYDGRIIDASIEGLTIGITYMYKDGKFEFGYGAGWFGWSVSIDFVELFKLLFGGE